MTIDTFLIQAIAIAVVVSALTYSTCLSLQLPRRVNLGITYAFGLIVLLYLIENPAVLQDTVAKIAAILIGAVIALALLVRKRVS
jgi:uncharacterized membrane protein YqgA involved in biofilm formation